MRTISRYCVYTVLTAALVPFVPAASWAQYGGYGGFGGYGGGGFGGYGGFGGGFGGAGGAAGPGTALVKYGEKVFDAVFGDLIDYKVYNIQVPADTIGVHYFDDGTNGDEVPYDGLPSYIMINRDTYIGPFTIKYKKQLQTAVEVARDMGAHEFYNLMATSESDESRVRTVSQFEQQFNDLLEEARTQIAQYEGYDDERYIKSVDPSLFESLEGGFGGFGGGLGAGGVLPDLPPPPGLPEPNVRRGLPETLSGEGGAVGSDTGSPPAQRFDPVGRALDVAEAANELP